MNINELVIKEENYKDLWISLKLYLKEVSKDSFLDLLEDDLNFMLIRVKHDFAEELLNKIEKLEKGGESNGNII